MAARTITVDVTVSYRSLTALPSSRLLDHTQANAQSDTVCPFCILGINQLKYGVEAYNKAHPSAVVKLNHRLHPYQLRAEMSDEPVPRNADMDARYGSGGRGPVIRANLAQQFSDVGLTYAKDTLLSNTNRAHRLENLAKTKLGDDKSWDVGMDLMKAYQIDGLAPSDPKVIAEIGVKHGVFKDVEEGKAWALGNDRDKETKAAYADARNSGISGVPNFIFNDKYQTSGAIGVDAFKGIIEQIVAKEDRTEL